MRGARLRLERPGLRPLARLGAATATARRRRGAHRRRACRPRRPPPRRPRMDFVIAVGRGGGPRARGRWPPCWPPITICPHLDTGLLYRGVGAAVLAAGGDPAHAPDAEAAARRARHLAAGRSLASDRPGRWRPPARPPPTPGVRAALYDLQRRFALQPGGAVLDGRDIGTVIAPEAAAKLFVDAALEVRARPALAAGAGAGRHPPALGHGRRPGPPRRPRRRSRRRAHGARARRRLARHDRSLYIAVSRCGPPHRRDRASPLGGASLLAPRQSKTCAPRERNELFSRIYDPSRLARIDHDKTNAFSSNRRGRRPARRPSRPSAPETPFGPTT